MAGEISRRWTLSSLPSTAWMLVLLLSSAALDRSSLAAAAPAKSTDRPIKSDDANPLSWGPALPNGFPGMPPRYPPPPSYPMQWYPDNYPQPVYPPAPAYPPPAYPPPGYPDLSQYDVCTICQYYPNYQQYYPADVCYRCRSFGK